MIFILMRDAQDTLTEISDFIDSINTQGAGERWVGKFIDIIEDFAASADTVTYALCSNDYLASLGFSCFNHNDWIVAFTIEEDSFIVHRIIRGVFLV